MRLFAGNGRDAILQLRKALRDVKGERSRRWGDFDQRRACSVVRLRHDTMPANAEAVVSLTQVWVGGTH
jgi:hypothetical protein